MPRIERDSDGYWYMDGEKLSIGEGDLSWEEEQAGAIWKGPVIIKDGEGGEIECVGTISLDQGFPVKHVTDPNEPIEVEIEFKYDKDIS